MAQQQCACSDSPVGVAGKEKPREAIHAHSLICKATFNPAIPSLAGKEKLREAILNGSKDAKAAMDRSDDR